MRMGHVIRWSWVAAVALVLASAAPSYAFYWYGWPGSGLPPPRTVVTPPPIEIPPGTPPEKPPTGPPIVVPPGQPPSPTPEPGTALVALIGLGTLAAARARRRRK